MSGELDKAEKKKRFDELLGIGKPPTDVCRPEYCSLSEINRQGGKKCKGNHPTGNFKCCDYQSNEQYRCKK